MLRFRRKKKIVQPLDEGRMRQIIHDELGIHDVASKEASDKEKHSKLVRERIMKLPKNKRRQFLRYLEKKGAKHGKR